MRLQPASAALDETIAVLSDGGLAVIPTDTVYGLAANAAIPAATTRIFACKGRDATVPVAVLCADAEQALALTAGSLPSWAADLAARHWPGPLTIVAVREPTLDWELGEPRTTVGLRCPDHDFVRGVAAVVGPLATTSANVHGRPTPADARAAAEQLLEPVELVVDGGPLSGTPSTVVDATGPEPVVLRQGALELGTDG